jgi:hypothetical protein
MSIDNEEPYSTIFASLKHPIRRRILRMLSEKSMSFSEMLEVLGVSNSFLTYHLENLGVLVGKTDDGRYRLSSFGEAAMSTMMKVEDIPKTALQQSPQTKPRRVIGRSVAIALGTVCILLIASLGGTFAYYTMTIHNKENELASANDTISQLNTNLTNLQNQNKQLQTWLVGNLTLLDQTKWWLNDIRVDSENSTVWVNNETYPQYERSTLENNETINWIRPPQWSFWVPYAGYVSVMFSSNNTPTHVEFSSYSNGTVDMRYLFEGGSIGWLFLPVSPSTFYSVSLDNPLGKPSDFTVTITYYY